jgi:hypothetical protein
VNNVEPVYSGCKFYAGGKSLGPPWGYNSLLLTASPPSPRATPERFNLNSPKKQQRYVTPWSRVLLQKLTVAQIVKELPGFNGTRRFFIFFKRLCH